MLQGAITRLRPVQIADIRLLRQWESDPHIAHWLTTTATTLDARESIEQEYDRLVKMPRIKLLAILEQRDDAEGSPSVVGFLRLHDIDPIDRKAIVRLFIAPDQQNKGYGTDALRTIIRFSFQELGLHRLGLVVRADHALALAVYERLGFIHEGREREAAWSAGQWVDLLHMGLLVDEWREGQG